MTDSLFLSNKGFALENLIFLELIKSGKNIFYYFDGHECDFLVLENERLSEAIQACYNIYDEKTKKREEQGLISACSRFKYTYIKNNWNGSFALIFV